MPRKIIKTKKFLRTFEKVIQKYPSRIYDIIDSAEDLYNYLEQGLPIPSKYKNHKVGDYWECHLCSRGSDILLVYDKYKTSEGTIIELICVTDHANLNRQVRSSLIDLDYLEHYLSQLSDSEFDYVVSIIERRLKHKRFGEF